MNSGGRTLNQRSMACTAMLAIALMATGVGNAATYTPGNIVVATCPTTAGAQQVTLTEYTSTGAIVGVGYAIPVSGSPPFGGMNGSSTTSSQINFGSESNQIIYVATSFTNATGTTPRVPGFVRVNNTSGTPVIDQATPTGDGDQDMRGIEQFDCRVFTGSGSRMKRTTGVTIEDFLAPNGATAPNCRWMGGRLGSDMYMSTGSGATPFTGGPGVFKAVLTDPLPVTPTLVIPLGASASPLGLFVPDANTVYIAMQSGGGFSATGLYKFTFDGSSWTNQGLNTAVGSLSQVSDVDGTVSGGNVTLYAINNTSVWRLTDTLTSTGATWTGAAATQIVTSLARGRSVAIVPPVPAAQTFNVNVSTTGSGFGSVAKSPPTGPYAKCSTVNLTATANPGSVFVGWGGDASGVTNPLPVLVDGNKNITAQFDLLAGQKILNLTGVGDGSINATPPNTNFASPGGPYPIVQPNNTAITLSATPDSNWIFDHWSGDVNPGDEFFDTITVTLTANKNVTCVFKQLFRVRNFATGNGTNTITGPTPDGTGPDGFPLYRDGTQVSFSSTAGNIGSPANTWTFTEYQDAALVTLSTNPIFTTAPLTAPLDVTAVFVETPNSNTASAFAPRDIVIGTIKDFFSPGVIQLREYNSAGQLVQPVVTVPSTGTPSAVTDLPTSTTAFDINFDAANDSRLYIAGQGINAVLPNQVGFIRTQFSGGSHIFDLAKGNQANTNGRGAAANGNDVYWSFDSGIRRYDIAGDAISTVLGSTANTRMIEVFNSALYSSTSSASGLYTGGPGIFRVDDPNGTPSANLVFQVPTITANAPNLLSFKFANANNCYIGLQAGNGYGGLLKFYFDGSNWINRNTPLALGTDWARGVDVVVSGNNVRVYFQHTFATSEGRLSYIDDTLDNTSDWENLPLTTIVPLVSRGRSVAIVPGNPVPVCTTCLGDVVQDSKVNGVDVQGFVKCLLGVGGTNCQCGDFNGSGTVTSADIAPFIIALRTSTSCP